MMTPKVSVEKEDRFQIALSEWREILTPTRVLEDESHLDNYARDLIPHLPRARAILKPLQSEEIQSILEVANRYKIPVYPISRGKNWGYGAACPVEKGNVILDLSGMNKIHEVNEELAYCVIEPGVTQQQLANHLRENNIPLALDVTGAPPDASVMGNIMERGLGYSRYHDRLANSSAFEVILPNGDILKTGFSHFQNAQAQHVFPYGLGPHLNGLFTQSNFGIVTKMTVWLTPVPEKRCSIIFDLNSDENLARLIDSIREFKLQGLINETVHIGNQNRVVSLLLPPGRRFQSEEEFCRQYHVPQWKGSVGLAGPKKEVDLRKKLIKKRLSNYSSIIVLTERLLKFISRFPRLAEWITRRKLKDVLPVIQSNWHMLNGIPSTQPLRGLYPTTQKRPPDAQLNPLDDHCGQYWYSGVIPATGKEVKNFLNLVRPIYEQKKIPLQVTFHFPNERSLVCLLSIGFNQNDPSECQLAKDCYQSLVHQLKKSGVLPYRLGVHSMKKFIDPTDPFWQCTKKIKSVLDPHNIISPGRYNL